MIKLSNLTKKYFETTVVSGLELEVKRGTIFGFLGPNGAGKTTTVKMIVGLSQPTEGSVSIDGKGLETLGSHEKIGYMPEDPYFYEQLNAYEFLDYMRSLFRNNKSDINKILDLVGLDGVKGKKVGTFSKGMKQRLGLAQALVNDPEYLFLDEPLDGLDPIGRLEFKKIFLKLKKEGKTIFFNSHVLSDVEEICDDIGIIDHGELIYKGSVEKFCRGKSLEKRFVEEITKLAEKGHNE